jgi:hypothetical protein
LAEGGFEGLGILAHRGSPLPQQEGDVGQ